MKERKVRLFISSTFRDMNAERDYLNNYVFPQVRDYCHSRFIDFIPVDLRWGITEEASRNGLVMASCMEEVDNSRPFFVGILGGRYGWMPTPAELKTNRPSITQNKDWLTGKLAEHASITEIEMDYAVLRDKSVPHASFFIKSDAVELAPEFREVEGSLAAKKLKLLKAKIRQQTDYPVHTYTTPKDMGDMLLTELISMISSEFPEEAKDYATSVISRHEASLERHAFTLFDIPNTADNMELWGRNDYPPLLITGPSGSGTSNCLAIATKYMRKTYPQNRVLYYDFENASADRNLMDDFEDFLQLKENHVPDDQWAMLSVDNASLLDMEQIERMMLWMREKSDNLHLAFAASSSLFSDTMQLQHYDTITQNGLLHQMQFDMINNFTRLYGKQLTEAQQRKIVSGKHSNDPTILTILLHTLINFGSMEQLDQRIEQLVHESNFSIFAGLIHEAESVFSQENLSFDFALALVVIAMHGDEGITERDLLEALQMPMAQWAIVRPMVLQFCHGNTLRLRFIQSTWRQDVKNHYSTPWIANTGYHMIFWWAKQHNRQKESAAAIASIYLYIWNLPFDNGEDVKLMEQHALSVILSPKTVLTLPYPYLSSLWRHFRNTPFSSVPPILTGQTIGFLPMEEQKAYYMRLAHIAESLNRDADKAWCYRQMAQLHGNSTTATLFEAHALLAEGRATKAVESVTGFLHRITGSHEEQLQKRLIRIEAFLQRGDIDDYLIEVERIFDLINSMDDTTIESYRKNLYVFYMQMVYELAFRTTGEWLKLAAEYINEAIQQNMLDGVSIANPVHYTFYMARVFLYAKSEKWEQMLQQANYAKIAGWHAFGGGSYQYGRAHALHNFAYKQLHGKLYDSRTVRTGNYNALPYLREINPALADKEVVRSIEQENKVYQSMIRNMGG